MKGSVATSPASSPGSSSGLSHTPTGVPRFCSSARCAFQSASGTTMGPSGSGSMTSGSSKPTNCHDSGWTCPSRMMRSGSTGKLLVLAVDARLEGGDADALDGVHEELVGMAQLEVGLDERGDHIRHLGRGEGRADHLSQRGVVALAAADRDLVPLAAVLVHAEDADVAHVMVAARIHAARDVEVQLADVVEVIEVGEAILDGERDQDRLGVRERAEI